MDLRENNIDTTLDPAQTIDIEPVTFEWKSDNNGISFSDTITLSADTINSYAYVPPGDMKFSNAMWNSSSLTSPHTISGMTGVGVATPWMTTSPPTSAKISLSGEGADVEVNGWSLVAAVKRIEERLGLFQPNPELEKEWGDLQALGEQYRKLEQYIRDKQATWDRIKAMPAPDID
jgi:hypothetical protein